jgi:hypothetical protein
MTPENNKSAHQRKILYERVLRYYFSEYDKEFLQNQYPTNESDGYFVIYTNKEKTILVQKDLRGEKIP